MLFESDELGVIHRGAKDVFQAITESNEALYSFSMKVATLKGNINMLKHDI